MTGSITVRKRNETHLIFRGSDSGIDREIADFFTFYAEGYKYHPLYKRGMWDGKVRLADSRSHSLYCGLFDHLREFARTREYELINEPDPVYGSLGVSDSITPNELALWAGSLQLTAHGERIDPKDYQLEGVLKALNDHRTVLISPTSSGKSLMIYLTIRWLLDHGVERILLVCPTVNLVGQMASDFEDYSSINRWPVKELCHQIYAGQDKDVPSARVTISTWQSLTDLGPLFFQKYGAVIGDEAHTFKAKSLCAIMEKLTQARYRIGTTGTIPEKSQVNKLVLTGVFGPIHRVISTKELIEQGTVADVRIDVLLLKYSEAECRACKEMSYQEEVDFLVAHAGRNRLIRNLTIAQERNTLLLFNYVQKHGRVLYDMIQAKLAQTDPNRKVFFISGEVEAEDREAVRKITEKEENAIIVASVGTFSTGVNIRNLYSAIFAAPTKSQIRTLQSLGRILRKHGEGKKARVFDLADDLHWKKHRNFTLNHAAERIRIYASERFDHKITEVEI